MSAGRLYGQTMSTKQTPQTEQIPGTDQVNNNAGGFGWALDDWGRLERFLILGAEGGTYYTGKKKLVKDNATAVIACFNSDPTRTLAKIVEVSESGRALKNDQAIFAIALAVKTIANPSVKEAAYLTLPRVCRTGSHLLQFLGICRQLGGVGGLGFQRAIAKWYLNRPASDLAYQVAKYQNREGETHYNAVRLAHPRNHLDETETQKVIIDWVLHGWDSVGESPHPNPDLQILWAFEQAKTLKEKKDIPKLIDLITKYRLPHEMVMTEAQRFPEVWEAMLPSMGVTALIRNLGKMTNLGVIAPLSAATKYVVEKLNNSEVLRKARIHPLKLLIAQKQYEGGSSQYGGKRGVTMKWSPVPMIYEALDSAFYKSFKEVTPSGKNFLLAIDCSDSMTWESSRVCGKALQAREGAAVMALATANVEPMWHIMGFDHGLVDINFTKNMNLSQVCRAMAVVRHGGTDCAIPMVWAAERKVEVNVFCIYTDNETHSGSVHVTQALNQYRQKMGRDAKVVVIGMTSDGFTIADPNDAGMLDMVGFDANAPAVISSFAGVSTQEQVEDE